MKNKILFTIIFLISFVAKSYSQNTDIQLSNLYLEQAINYATKESPDVKTQRLQTSQEKLRLLKSRLKYMPNIYASADARYNIIVPSTPIPANMINPAAEEGKIMYMKFNTPWALSGGLNLSFDIFSPDIIGANSQQKQQLAISQLDEKIAKKELHANVMQAYVDCLIAQAQHHAMTADTVYYTESERENAKLFAKGKISQVERNAAILSRNASISRLMKGEEVLYQAKINLLLAMGVDVSEENIALLNLSETIEDLQAKFSAEELQGGEMSLSERRQEKLVRLSELRTKTAKLKYAPSLTLNGYYGANYFDNDLKIGKKERWFGNSFIALSLKLPLVLSISNAKDVEESHLQTKIEQENLRKIQNSYSANLLKEQKQIANRRAQYQLKQQNLTLSEQNLKAKESESRKGYTTYSQLYAEKLNQQNAYKEYLEAAYDMLSGFVNLLRIK